MLRNYLVVGLRALLKSRAYATINILGLAIGMAACLLLLLYVRYEMSYDRWLPDADRTFQLQNVSDGSTNSGAPSANQYGPYVAAVTLRKDFPEIERVAYAMNDYAILMKDNTPVAEQALRAERDFFSILRIPFLYGSGAAALADPNTVALSRSAAIKLFGTANVIGRTVPLVAREGLRPLRVMGVFADLPKNTHQDFDVVRLFDPKSFTGDRASILTNWGEFDGWIYARLRPGADAQAINARMPAWQARNVPVSNIGGEMVRADEGAHYFLTAVPDIHLGRAQDGAAKAGNDRGTILAFAGVALLVLGMACVNFTNLATARATQRAREVALRKVLGASRRQLVTQYLGEAVLVSAIAMLLALAIAELALPWLAAFLDADLSLHYFGRDGILPPVLALVLIVGLAAGAYPALRLSSFQPARVLKANRSTDAEGSGLLRSALVIGQFAISIALIVCTVVIHAQTVHAMRVDPGFRRDGLLQIDGVGGRAMLPHVRTFEQQVRALPGVVAVTRTNIGVRTGNRSNNLVRLPGQTHSISLAQYPVEPGFFDVMGIRLLAGRALSEGNALDDGTLPDGASDAQQQALVARGLNVVLARSAAARLGFRDPQAAIGKRFDYSFVDNKNGLLPTTIVGVVEDARWRSAREAVEPIIYFRDDSNLQYMEVRFATNDPIALRDRIGALWKGIAPQIPYDARFADEEAAKSYRADRARAQIFGGFALLAVLIGCLGLFGLAAFTAERRTKEIGIRKVLGARTRDIVRLLVWQFSRPVLVANLLAWPVAWWLMRGWLDGFDTRVALTPAPFLAAGLLALAIAVATIGAHAMRVARANPIHALRYE